MVDAAARFAQRRDVVAHAKLHARRLAQPGQFARELVGVAGLICRGEGGTRQLRADVGERGLDAHRLVGADHLALAAQGAHLLGGGQGAVELLGAGVEVQDALRALVVLDAGGGAQLLQRVAAVGAQAHDLLDVVARARRGAFAQERKAPEPLAHVGAQAEQQRRILLAQPLQHLERRAGVGPGLGVAHRDLAAVGKAGLGAGRALAVDDGHFVTQLREEISRSHAEQAGAQNDHAHDFQSLSGLWRKNNMRWQL